MRTYNSLDHLRRALWGRAKTVKGEVLPLLIVRSVEWAVVELGEKRLPDAVIEAIERGDYTVIDGGTLFSAVEQGLLPKASSKRARAGALRRAGFDPDDF